MPNIRTTFEPPIALPRSKHGTRSGYCAGCRCEPCVMANRVWKREWRGQKPYAVYLASVKERAQRHGRAAYDRGCRCAVCRTANADYYRRMRNDELPVGCKGCEQSFRNEHGLAIHVGRGCPGPVLGRVTPVHESLRPGHSNGTDAE